VKNSKPLLGITTCDPYHLVSKEDEFRKTQFSMIHAMVILVCFIIRV